MVKESPKGRRKRRSTFRKRKPRNYAQEYARRVEKGLAAGKSRSQARGHARAGERPKPSGPTLVKAKSREEQAIRKIARGATLRAAAKEYGITEQRLRRYMHENVQAVRVGGKWQISDARPRQFPFYSNGRVASPWLSPDEAKKAGEYMNAVGRFLFNHKEKVLRPYKGNGATDMDGRYFVFETNIDTLLELDNAGELSFPEIYKIVS